MIAWFIFRLEYLFLFLALLSGGFLFWRRIKEEHYDELQIFDFFIGSLVIGTVAARALFIVTHFAQFGWNAVSWLDVLGQPGLHLFSIPLVSYLILRKKLTAAKVDDQYLIFDYWALSMAVMTLLVVISWVLTGSHFGLVTQLPWGVVASGVFDKRHPAQWYSLLIWVGIVWYLFWAEFRYRTFEWYRAGRNSAESGYLFCLLIILAGLWWLGSFFVSGAELRLFSFPLDPILALVTLGWGVVTLLQRTGKIRVNWQ